MNAPSSAEPSTASDPRVALAAERTLLAWIRTSIAMMGFGFVVARFGLFLRVVSGSDSHVHPTGIHASQWLGTALVALGALVNVLAVAQYARLLRSLEAPPTPYTLGAATALALTAIGLILAMVLALG